MIALILNEESIPLGDADEVQPDWVNKLSATIVAAQKVQKELKVTRVSREWLDVFKPLLYKNRSIKQTVKSFLLKNLRPPFLANEDEDDHIESYISCTASFSSPVALADVECGKVARIYGFPLISANLSPWDRCLIKGHYDCGGEELPVEWDNMSTPEHVTDCHAVMLDTMTPAAPPESTIRPEDKLLDTGKHHGQKELAIVGKKLRDCPFVDAMPGSADFDGFANAFAPPKRIYENNGTWFIKVVLYRTKEGFSLLVQTTARNKHEAEYIASVLEQWY